VTAVKRQQRKARADCQCGELIDRMRPARQSASSSSFRFIA
jgi:hypothetical protein